MVVVYGTVKAAGTRMIMLRRRNVPKAVFLDSESLLLFVERKGTQLFGEACHCSVQVRSGGGFAPVRKLWAGQCNQER